MGLRYFVFLVLLGLTLSTLTVDAKSLKAKHHKKSHHEEKKHDEPAPEELAADDASGSAGESGSAEESGAPPTESATPAPPAKPLPYKVIGPLGGHPHPGPPSAMNPCPQPRYCDPARCKDPVGCAPSCSETCCADILIPPPTPPVGSGAGPCPQTCAPSYLADCCMGAAPPMGPAPAFPQMGPQPVFPPMGPQPEFSPPTGQMEPAYVPQAPPASCDQSCYATNCAPPCPAQCCSRKKSSIHHRHHRKTRSLTTGFAMCH